MTALEFNLELPAGRARIRIEPVTPDEAAWLLETLGCDLSLGDEVDVGQGEETEAEVDEELQDQIRFAILAGHHAPNSIAMAIEWSESRVRRALSSMRQRGLLTFDRHAGMTGNGGWHLAGEEEA